MALIYHGTMDITTNSSVNGVLLSALWKQFDTLIH